MGTITVELAGGPADGPRQVAEFLGNPPATITVPYGKSGWWTYHLCTDGKYRQKPEKKKFERMRAKRMARSDMTDWRNWDKPFPG